MKKCDNCIHEIICKSWMLEMKSVEEIYQGTDYVNIYDRHQIDGDGCEYHKSEAGAK